jgi:hypothetical protein
MNVQKLAGEARLELAVPVLETGALAAKLHSHWHRPPGTIRPLPVHSGALCH